MSAAWTFRTARSCAGVVGSSLESTGYIWLAITDQARRYPLEFVRTVRRELDVIMLTKRELVTTVITDDPVACRFAAFMGFHVSHDGPGSPAYSRMGRRNLVNHITQTPELRMPMGKGYCIPMGYHREEAAL